MSCRPRPPRAPRRLFRREVREGQARLHAPDRPPVRRRGGRRTVRGLCRGRESRQPHERKGALDRRLAHPHRPEAANQRQAHACPSDGSGRDERPLSGQLRFGGVRSNSERPLSLGYQRSSRWLLATDAPGARRSATGSPSASGAGSPSATSPSGKTTSRGNALSAPERCARAVLPAARALPRRLRSSARSAGSPYGRPSSSACGSARADYARRR